MKLTHLLPYGLSISATILLAACGGSQLPIGAPGAMPQSHATSTHVERGGSWMLPEAKTEDLLYVAASPNSYVLSYPTGKIVGTISVNAIGACADRAGDVFLAVGASLLEYAHGATNPIATFNLPANAYGCSVDSRTDDLAVTYESDNGADVAVFPGGKGSPRLYEAGTLTSTCGYDENDNLFVDGFDSSSQVGLWELSRGSSSFAELTINRSLPRGPGQVQWNHKRLTVEVGDGYIAKPLIYRLKISGLNAVIRGHTVLHGHAHRSYQSWIWNGSVFLPYAAIKNDRIATKLGVWSYPEGALLKKYDTFPKGSSLYGVTVSVGRPQ